mgnify:CR=1 FL=1
MKLQFFYRNVGLCSKLGFLIRLFDNDGFLTKNQIIFKILIKLMIFSCGSIELYRIVRFQLIMKFLNTCFRH